MTSARLIGMEDQTVLKGHLERPFQHLVSTDELNEDRLGLPLMESLQLCAVQTP